MVVFRKCLIGRQNICPKLRGSDQISMYESLGYYATNIIMKKDIGNLIKH